MTKTTERSRALAFIKSEGICLAFPKKNSDLKKEPDSIWRSFYPRSKMKWEWDEAGDGRVFRLWHLRAELSKSSQVVYVKWFQDRGTFLSKEYFSSLYLWLNRDRLENLTKGLSSEAENILNLLQESSPQSPKLIRKRLGLKGKDLKKDYDKAIKSLFRRLLIVGYGEKEDGSFPSLMLGSSALLFEQALIAQKKKLNLESRIEKICQKHQFLKRYLLRYEN